YSHALNWYIVYNHKYLITYWCLALACSRWATNPGRVLAVNGRLLIGLCFLCATLWKVISPDFLDGSFFHFTLLDDARFRSVAESLGRMPEEIFRRNEQAIASLSRYDSLLTVVQLEDTPRIIWLAKSLAWWGFGLEALIALAFLWPE